MNRFILLTFILINAFSLYSQEVIWEKLLFLDTLNKIVNNHPNKLHGYSVNEDSQRNLLVSVLFNSKPQDGGANSAVLKFDSYGNLIWYHLFFKSHPLFPSKFFQDKTGNYIFLGKYPLYSDWENSICDKFVSFVAKFSAENNIPIFEHFTTVATEIEKILPSNPPNFFFDSNGNIVFTSVSKPAGLDTLFMLRFDNNGNFISYSPIDTLEPRDSSYGEVFIVQDEANNYFICGNLTGRDNWGRVFVIKTNNSLKREFIKFYEISPGIGEYILDCKYFKNNIFLLSRLGGVSRDSYPKLNVIRKLDLNGNLIYQNLFGIGDRFDRIHYFTSFVINEDGLPICAGVIQDLDNTVWIPKFPTITKIGYDGMMEWNYFLPSISNLKYDLTGIINTTDDSYVVVGRAGDSLYLAKLSIPPSKVDGDNQGDDLLDVFPSPCFECGTINVKIHINQMEDLKLAIYNSMGSLLQKINLENISIGENYLSIQRIPNSSGVFWVRLEGDGKIIASKPLVFIY